MPLNMHESKKLIVGMFRLALAASERRSEDAVKAFSEILDTTIMDQHDKPFPPFTSYQQSRFDIDAASSVSDSSSMPELVPLSTVHNYLRTMNVQQEQEQEQADDAVKLVISETEEQKPLDSNHPVNTRIDSASNTTTVLSAPEQKEEEAEDDEVEEQEQEQEEDDEVEEEEEEEAEDDEEEELQLVPVRIKKVTYWKDELTGDIYQYLPDDECGDKVGTYVDGKPVFD